MIKVIDSIMGSGKSSFAIQEMNKQDNKNYIYITPYLNEITRIKQNCNNRHFYEPKIKEKEGILTKTKALKELIKGGRDIATTHSLFKIVDKDTEELLTLSNYTLVLDEVMDVVQQIPITKADQELLFEKSKILAVGEDNKIVLGEGAEEYISLGSGKFSELIYMAKLNRMFKFEDVVILWEFPVDIFNYFKEVYILTYLFDGQIQKYFFDYYNVKYNKYTIINNNNTYEMIDYNPLLDTDRINSIREKITIHESKLNSIGDNQTSFSYNWYMRATTDIKEMISNNIYNYFRNIENVRMNDCMWTTFKKFSLEVHNYKRAFVSHNARATNEYSNTHTLAYCVNRYISPYLVKYFKYKNIEVDEDIYALSEMIQWIWRSRIRNDEHINIYIPNQRMRNLLKSFLEVT